MAYGINNPGANDPFGGTSGNAPTGAAGSIFSSAQQKFESGTTSTEDQARQQAYNQYKEQLQQNAMQRQFAGQEAIQTVGDIKSKIFDTEMQARQAEAQQGGVGPGAEIRRAKQMNQQVNQSETNFENSYIDQLRGINSAAVGLQAGERNTMKGSQAVKKAFADYAAKQNKDMTGQQHEDNWFVHAAKWLAGYKSATHNQIDWNKASKDKDMQKLSQQLGVDLTDKATQNYINKEIGTDTEVKGHEDWGMLANHLAFLAAAATIPFGGEALAALGAEEAGGVLAGEAATEGAEAAAEGATEAATEGTEAATEGATKAATKAAMKGPLKRTRKFIKGTYKVGKKAVKGTGKVAKKVGSNPKVGAGVAIGSATGAGLAKLKDKGYI